MFDFWNDFWAMARKVLGLATKSIDVADNFMDGAVGASAKVKARNVVEEPAVESADSQ